MVAMAMEGEPRNTECKLHLINDAVIWNACPKVHFHLWSLHEGTAKNIKVNISRALFRSYGASLAVEMQQKGVQSAYKDSDMYHVKNCFVISLSTIMNIPLKVKVNGCMGNTHTLCYQSTFLAGSKELNLVSKK